MKTIAAVVLLSLLNVLPVFGQYWKPNSDGHFIPVVADAQNIGSQTLRIGDVWVNVIRLKGPNNQLVIDANLVGQRSTIMFQNQMTNIGAFTFRNGSADNWYISGYGGVGETFNEYTGLETNTFIFGEQDGDIFTAKPGSTLYLTNSFYLPGKFIVPGYAVQSLLAAGTIIATNMNILVQGSGAARTLTSTPTIAAPSIDTLIILTGNSDANTLTLQDEATLPGSLLRLQASTRTLGLYDKLALMYSVAHSVWEEVFFSPGGGGGGGASVSDIAFASSWDGVTADAPSKNVIYDYAHTTDTDDDGLPNVLDSTFTFNGFSVSGDGDGAITLLGAGNGSDEDLTINLDDTANNAIVTSSTGVTNVTLTAINLTVPAAVYDATAWDGNLTAPTRDDVRDVLEGFAEVDDTAYDATSWNGNLDAPTKNAVRDKIEALGSGSTHALLSATHTDTAASTVVRGDLMVGNSTPAWDNLAIATRQLSRVSSDGTDVYWASPRTEFTVDTDFMQSNLFGEPWEDTVSGTAAAAQLGNSTYVDGNHPGVCELTTGSQAAGRASVSAGSAANLNQIRLGGGRAMFTAIIKVPVASDGTETYTLRLGFGDSSTADFTDGVYFEHDSSSANWSFKAANNSTRSTVLTTTAVDTSGWIRLEIIVAADGSSANAYINGVEVVASSGTYPIVSNIPTTSGRHVGVIAAIIKSAGTTSRVVPIDYIGANIKFTSLR